MPNDPLLVDLALPFFPRFAPSSWARLGAAGPRWRGAILRGGLGLADDGPRVGEHARAIRAAGLELGVYWYQIYRRDPVEQADAFANLLVETRPTLLPILDVEGGGNEGVSSAEVTRETLAFVEHLRKRTGQEVILYAGGWLRGLLGKRARRLGCDRLWLSAYTPHPQGYFEPMGFELKDVPWWQYAGADARGVHAKLAGFPRTTPIGNADITVEIVPGGIDAAGWVGTCGLG
jgi:GH25 family lysozyme M1 (1,4-beta-N-acetylmuramidase)